MLGFVTVCVAAQNPVTELTKKYPSDMAVFLDRSEVLNISFAGDSLSVLSEVYEEMAFLKEQVTGLADKKIYGNSFAEVKDIQAKTLVWDKSRFRDVPVTDIRKKNDQDDNIFYDDSYYQTFNFPQVALGNKTQLRYKMVQKEARFIPGFLFSSYLPQVRTTYTVQFPKDVDLHYEILNDPKGLIRFSKSEKGKMIQYTFTATDLPAIAYEDDSPAVRYYEPHVVCYVKSFTKNGKTTKVLSELKDLYSTYHGYIKHLNVNPSEDLKKVVADIKQNSKTELDIVRNVFYWVQSNIQYIAFEQGMRGFIPNDASYTCEKRYGDCKDMANLIVGMLAEAGVKSYHTWIGSRNIPYRYSKLPTPLVDDHMIATYVSPDGSYYFLDATSDYTTFGYPSSMIQGKEALIAFSDVKFEVREVPVINKEKNFSSDSISLNIVGNQLVGRGRYSMWGFPKTFGSYSLDRAEEDNVRKYVTRLLSKGSNKFFLDRFTVNNLTQRDQPVFVDYEFRVSDYHQSLGDEIYINLNLNKDYYNAFINMETRKTPIESDYKYVKNEYYQFEIPAGYEVEYMPENVHVSDPLMGLEVAYRKEGSKILFTKKFYLDYLLMDKKDFEVWNQSVKKISEVYKDAIILKKKQ